jgi:hypothetical protein
MSSYPNLVFDYGLVIQAGIPSFILAIIAITSLLSGIILMDILLPLAGIGMTTPFWQVLALNLMAWPFYLALRMIYQSVHGIPISGSISLFIFGLIVAILTALPFKQITNLFTPITHTDSELPSMGSVWLSVGLGVGLTIILMLSNNIWFG